MRPFPSASQNLNRGITYPLAVSVVRLIAVAQAVAAPLGPAPQAWIADVLFAYAVVALALTLPFPTKQRAAEPRTQGPAGPYALVVMLDIAAAAFFGWKVGWSALVLLPGFDAAFLDVWSAAGVLVVAVSAIGYAYGLRQNVTLDAGLERAIAFCVGPYVAAAFALAARRSAERQIRAINHVLDAGSDMGTKLSMPDVLSQLLNMLRQFHESVPWQNVVVYVSRYDEQAREEMLCAEAIAGAHADFYRGSRLRFSDGVVGHSASEQRPVIVADMQREPRDASLPKPKAVRGAMVVPIVSEGVTIGAVMFTSASHGAFTFDQQRLVDRLIRLASVGIQNARLHSKTLELAETDSMTGLLTNRAYQERLDAEFRKAQTTKESLALLILDVDYFKHVNDTYGHPQGDELLRQLGDVIRQHARKDDICCRYGGDEFTVVMPQTIKAEAAMVAGRIRAAVEAKIFHLEGTTARITVSIGVAGYPQDTGTRPALVKAADDALYVAKQSGRNNVKLAARLAMQAKNGASIARTPTPIDMPDPYVDRPVR